MTRRFPSPRRLAAFTLIELLTVITIILILAALLIHIAGNAQYKSSVSRATAEVKAMETALESYKADNGTYPRILPSSTNGGSAGTSYSDQLNAQTDTDPGGSSAKAKYQGSSETLYQALSGITAFSGSTPTYGKRYMEFRPGQLSDASSGTYTTPTATTMIVDPFGLPYGYSTISTYASEQVASGNMTQTQATADGYNPTFDLWSSAGYGTGAKSYPTSVTTTNYYTLWAKNW